MKKTTDLTKTFFEQFDFSEEDIRKALIQHVGKPEKDSTVEFDVGVNGQLQGAHVRHTWTEKAPATVEDMTAQAATPQPLKKAAAA